MCIRDSTNSNTWCENGDQTGWNITAAERSALSSSQGAFSQSSGSDSKTWAHQLESTGDFTVHSPEAGSSYAENLDAYFSAGTYTPSEVGVVAKAHVDDWMDSPVHRGVIMAAYSANLDIEWEIGIASSDLGLFRQHVAVLRVQAV